MSNIKDAKPSYIKIEHIIQSVLEKKPLDIITAREWNNVLNTIIKAVNVNAAASDIAIDCIKGILNGGVDFSVDLDAKTLGGHPVSDFVLKEHINPYTDVSSTIDHNGMVASFVVTESGEENATRVTKAFSDSLGEEVPQYHFLYLKKDAEGNSGLGVVTIGPRTVAQNNTLEETFIGDTVNVDTFFKVPQYPYFAFMYSAPPGAVSGITIDEATTYTNDEGMSYWEIGIAYNTPEYQDFVRQILDSVAPTEDFLGYLTRNEAIADYLPKDTNVRWTYNKSEVGQNNATLQFTISTQGGELVTRSHTVSAQGSHGELLYFTTNASGTTYITSTPAPISDVNMSWITDHVHDFRNYFAYVYVASESPVRIDSTAIHQSLGTFSNGLHLGVVWNPHQDTVLAKQFLDRLYNEMQHTQMQREYSQLFD